MDKQLAIFYVDGTFYAMNDACLHKGLSLGTSRLDGKIVTCRGHGWRYSVTTGCTLVHGLSAHKVACKEDEACEQVYHSARCKFDFHESCISTQDSDEALSASGAVFAGFP